MSFQFWPGYDFGQGRRCRASKKMSAMHNVEACMSFDDIEMVDDDKNPRGERDWSCVAAAPAGPELSAHTYSQLPVDVSASIDQGWSASSSSSSCRALVPYQPPQSISLSMYTVGDLRWVWRRKLASWLPSCLQKQHADTVQDYKHRLQEVQTKYDRLKATADQDRAAFEAELERCRSHIQKQAVDCDALCNAAAKERGDFEAQLRRKDTTLTNLQQQLSWQHKQAEQLQQQLDVKEAEFTTLTFERDSLQRALQAKDNTMQDLRDQVDRLQNAGRELLSYRGIHSAGANQSALKAVLKDVSNLAAAVAGEILKNHWANPYIPTAIDTAVLTADGWLKAQSASMQHALLLSISSDVFEGFRRRHLMMPSLASTCTPEVLQAQLMLERNEAQRLLDMLSECGTVPPPELAVPVQQLCESVVGQIVHAPAFPIDWCVGVADIGPSLHPNMQQLVLAALKAQAVVSTMHSRLLQLVVPGWHSGLNHAVFQGWWPGVARFDSKFMERGGHLPAAEGILGACGNSPAAVFCQDVGVIQFGNCMSDVAPANVPPAGCEGPCGPPQSGAMKVLKKPRMFLAV